MRRTDVMATMRASALILVVLIAAACRPATAAPFIPGSDGEILERLPFSPGDPAVRGLRGLRDRLAREPRNLPLALRVARGFSELGRATGDPRYAGYAEAVLSPWWILDRPPPEVLLLRAQLRQRVHRFDEALDDLATVLREDPRNPEARLARATVLQVRGEHAAARGECRALRGLTRELVREACLAGVDAVTGRLGESYRALRDALDRDPAASPALRGWALTSLAEMADRAGMAAEAEAHFRGALVLDGGDFYLLGAYADFLLDSGRADEAGALLRDKTRADPLLLRYALALRAQGSSQLPGAIEQLRDRFAASRLRGDRVHLREEARFALHLLDAPADALDLARENWRVQKEPADLRILLEAALAADDPAAIAGARVWLAATRLEDRRLYRLLMGAAPQPTEGDPR
jgi:Tfp pilus assembly protein PilF